MIVTYPKKPKAITTPDRIFVKPHPYMFIGMQERKSEGEVEYRKVDESSVTKVGFVAIRNGDILEATFRDRKYRSEAALKYELGYDFEHAETLGWRIVKVRMEVIEE